MISVRTLLAELTALDLETAPPPQPPPDARLETAIRRHVEAVLRQTYGNRARAASRLGITRAVLARMLRRWQTEDAARGVRCIHCGALPEWIQRPGDASYYRCPACRVGFMA